MMKEVGLSALNWAAPRVYLYPNFLSDDEVDHLVSFARRSKVFKDADAKAAKAEAAGEPPPGPHLTSVYFGWDAIYKDPVVMDIEQRVAIVTGMPPHKHEEPLNVHRIRTVAPGLAWPVNATSCRGKDCPRKVTSIHHDKVQKEHSTATVLVYLNDVAEGGGTIFPCWSVPPPPLVGDEDEPPPPPPPQQQQQQQQPMSVNDACSEAFREGARWFDGSDTTVKGRPRKLTSPTPVDEELQTILWAAHLGCHEPGDGGSGGSGAGGKDATARQEGSAGKDDGDNSATAAFAGWKRRPIRSVPVKGSALVFFHTHPNGDPDPFAWHAGCLPVSEEKWTMQKFKEMPMQWR
jgi:hypothetical protein